MRHIDGKYRIATALLVLILFKLFRLKGFGFPENRLFYTNMYKLNPYIDFQENLEFLNI